jgi:hypothetical protein
MAVIPRSKPKQAGLSLAGHAGQMSSSMAVMANSATVYDWQSQKHT